MQCVWTSTLGVLRKPQWRTRWTPAAFGSRSASCRDPPHLRRKALPQMDWSEKKREFSSVARAFVSTAVRDTSIPPDPVNVSVGKRTDEGGASSQLPLTPAQLSRIAAQSVRLACQGASVRDAFIIVKSLKASVAHYGKDWYPGKPFYQKVAIDFGMAVSPRLALHSLLHGLIRRGMTKRAGEVALQVAYSPSMRLSNRTLRLVMTELFRTDSHALRDENFHSELQKAKADFGDYLAHPKEVTGRTVQLPCTRIAAQLFFSAKQYRRQRAKQMFQQLIDACLLQGEILIVSFLFALLVKQWQARLSKTTTGEDLKSSSPTGEPMDPSTIPLRPREMFLSQILAYITPVIFDDILPDPHAIIPSHEEAVQALAILAGMLHEDLLPYGQVGPLVRTLVLFNPSASVLVWTRRKGKKDTWDRRDAREYFDEVLDDLLAKIIGTRRGPYSNKRAKLETFNGLLIYALRRKGSPAAAERVIRRMHKLGGDVAPNITTFNIVLRASTAFRRQDMSVKILDVLRSRPENQGHAIMYTPHEQPEESKQKIDPDCVEKKVPSSSACNPVVKAVAQSEPSKSSCTMKSSTDAIAVSSSPLVPDIVLTHLSPTVQRILLEKFDVDCLSELERPLPADGDTLSAYLDYLTASGHPEAAAKLVKILLPELRIASYPPIHPEARRLGRRRRRFKRRIAISRALGLGPRFFTSALNALVKAGKTGLAERTWRLAKAAEGCSWNPEYKARPWILPCAAYTIMMQCYAMESRKACMLSRRYGVQQTGPERSIIGWGTVSVVKRVTRGQSLNLLEVSRDMGAHVLRSMQVSEEAYRARLISYIEEGGSVEDRRTVQPPRPDERFFNAALDLFGCLPGAYVRMGDRASPYRWRCLERQQLSYLMRHGRSRFPRDPRLVAVLFAMREAGYEIPLAYRHLLVGVTVPPSLQRPSRRRRRAYACFYRPPNGLDPVRLATSKDRGLPVQRSLKVVRW